MSSREGVGLTSEEGVRLTSEEGVRLTSEEGVGLTSEEGVGITSEEGVGLTSGEGVTTDRELSFPVNPEGDAGTLVSGKVLLLELRRGKHLPWEESCSEQFSLIWLQSGGETQRKRSPIQRTG